MSEISLYNVNGHRNVLLADASGPGLAIEVNHHLIQHGGQGLIVDPGGHAAFQKVFPDVLAHLQGSLKYLVLTHQDPDIVAATNGWLMVTGADAYISDLWIRFIPHFGIDELLEHRLKGVPDGGLWLDLGGAPIALVPAHFLHSAGNFQVWDPTAKILYTGDLGTSLGTIEREVTDFDGHIKYMEHFHTRYLAGGTMLKAWVRFARTLDIEVIAPQHGALFRGRAMVSRFLDWCEGLRCGMDLLADSLRLPPRG